MKLRVWSQLGVALLLLAPVAARADNFAFRFAFGGSC